MKVKAFIVLEHAISLGVAYGYARAHKHVENPTKETIIEEIENAVILSINDYFHFDEDDLL